MGEQGGAPEHETNFEKPSSFSLNPRHHMFKLLDTVVLTRDVTDAGLRRGDLGAIVEVYGPDAFEVEFVAASGRTQALITVTTDDIRHVDDQDLVAVRPLDRAVG